MKKTLSLLLAALMLAGAMTACSGGDTTDDTTKAADTTTAPVETGPVVTERKDAKDNIPADFTLNGKTMGIYIRSGMQKLDWDGGGEETGDVIYDAVYNRTQKVMERLKVNFELTSLGGTWQEFGKGMEQNIMAGDDTWQIVFTTGNAAIQSSRDYLFQDLTKNKYIDFDQPWWWTDAMKELSLDGSKIRYLVGDISMTNYSKAGAMFFNKVKLESAGFKSDDLYKMVIDRKWTYDKLGEMAAASYVDVNGDGVVNDGDQYGFYLMNNEAVRHLEFTGNIRRYSRDANGYPYLDYDQERATQFIDMMNKLLYETKGCSFTKGSAHDSTKFSTGATVFYSYRLESATGATLRDMEDDFGIIPNPMMNEEQGEYYGIIHNSSDYVTIPMTCKNPDEAGAVIEALCSESYRSVVETYYESALKAKYSRDSYSGQCIDIICDTNVKNFIYEYNGVVKGGVLIGDEILNNRNEFASKYAAQKDSTNQKIQDLIEKYIKAEADLAG